MMEFLMSKHMTLCFGLFFAGFGLVYACSRMRYEWSARSVSAPNVLEGPQRHLVRPEMLIATAKMTDVVAPALRD